MKKNEENQKKNGKQPKQKWKTNQSTKIDLIGCDTIVNSPSLYSACRGRSENRLKFNFTEIKLSPLRHILSGGMLWSAWPVNFCAYFYT